ncbi:hypothetical protein [Arthrobacter sp. W4I7]|uniref:hypothetical protein n=1 Tax=Arthrobacter sp. W4I7 TaxID=3042296 RepID=UPI0027858807|nr:hypothetical protein [Arthrobacter sp. W4I7]MDQ0691014.1 hypothetical protein [Arthrobacter sp. W4I7]
MKSTLRLSATSALQSMRLEYRTRLLSALAFGHVVLIPVSLAWLTDLGPESSQADQLWGNLPVLCGLLLFVLIPSPVLKPACTLSEDHRPPFQYAVRTGVLPLASLFSDWTTELTDWRCGLEKLLDALPAAILISAGSPVYAAAVIPVNSAYFLTCAATSGFLGIVLIEWLKARFRNVCSLEEQLKLQRKHLAKSVTHL